MVKAYNDIKGVKKIAVSRFNLSRELAHEPHQEVDTLTRIGSERLGHISHRRKK